VDVHGCDREQAGNDEKMLHAGACIFASRSRHASGRCAKALPSRANELSSPHYFSRLHACHVRSFQCPLVLLFETLNPHLCLRKSVLSESDEWAPTWRAGSKMLDIQ
jgi:hypothetical protein